MKVSKVLKLILLCVIIFGIVGCAGNKTQAPTEEAIPPTPGLTVIEVSFDGNECTYLGPPEIPTGKYQFDLDDQSGKDLEVYSVRLLEGKTLQDLLDRQKTPGEYIPQPDWAVHPNRASSSDRKTWIHYLDKPGYHILDLGRMGLNDLWFCSPAFQVIDTASE